MQSEVGSGLAELRPGMQREVYVGWNQGRWELLPPTTATAHPILQDGSRRGLCVGIWGKKLPTDAAAAALLTYVQPTNQEGSVRSHAALVKPGHSLRAASALHICCIWDLVSLKGRRACWSLPP